MLVARSSWIACMVASGSKLAAGRIMAQPEETVAIVPPTQPKQ